MPNLRTVVACAVALLTVGAATPSLAACLGTERTIHVDGSKARFYNGLERSLGLRPKEVILTFDDGPVPGKTTRILDALRDECAKATFFMSGRMAKAYPSIAQRVRREGHTIASHTWDHANLAKVSTAAASASIDRGVVAIEAATGASNLSFFRYPYLAKTGRTDEIVARKGLIAFGANIDSKDYFKVSPVEVRHRTMARLRKQGRGIILMHDIHGRTADMLPALLDQLKAEGYKLVHMVPGRGVPNATARTTDAMIDREAIVASVQPKRKPAIDIATIAYAAERPVRAAFERVLPLDLLAKTGGRRASTIKTSVAERLRTQRSIRSNFRTATSGFPTDPTGVVVQLQRR